MSSVIIHRVGSKNYLISFNFCVNLTENLIYFQDHGELFTPKDDGPFFIILILRGKLIILKQYNIQKIEIK